MKPEKIREIVNKLGVPYSTAAIMLGYSDAPRIHELMSGKRNPGGAVLVLLHMLDRWPEVTAAMLREINGA